MSNAKLEEELYANITSHISRQIKNFENGVSYLEVNPGTLHTQI